MHTQAQTLDLLSPDTHSLPYRSVLPVADNLLQVGGWVEQEMLPPFIPVHSHGAVCIDTTQQEQTENNYGFHVIFIGPKIFQDVFQTNCAHMDLKVLSQNHLSWTFFFILHFLPVSVQLSETLIHLINLYAFQAYRCLIHSQAHPVLLLFLKCHRHVCFCAREV